MQLGMAENYGGDSKLVISCAKRVGFSADDGAGHGAVHSFRSRGGSDELSAWEGV